MQHILEICFVQRKCFITSMASDDKDLWLSLEEILNALIILNRLTYIITGHGNQKTGIASFYAIYRLH